MTNNLICKIIEKKGDKADIEIAGQKITIDSKYLPDAKEKVNLYFLSGDEPIADKKLSKLILEEILNGK